MSEFLEFVVGLFLGFSLAVTGVRVLREWK